MERDGRRKNPLLSQFYFAEDDEKSAPKKGGGNVSRPIDGRQESVFLFLFFFELGLCTHLNCSAADGYQRRGL